LTAVVVLLILLALSFVYWPVCTFGLIELSDTFAIKAHRTGNPLLVWMGDTDEWEKVTVGHLTAMLLMLACFGAWTAIASHIRNPPRPSLWNACVRLLAAVIIVLDAYVLYRGLTSSDSAFGGTSSMTAFVIALLWCAILVGLALFVHHVAHGSEES
jgi:hypothetical protein